MPVSRDVGCMAHELAGQQERLDGEGCMAHVLVGWQ